MQATRLPSPPSWWNTAGGNRRQNYFCPVRSVSSTLAQALQFNARFSFPEANKLQPLKTMLNEVAFEQYHLFRAEARVVAGEAADTESANALLDAAKPAEAAAAQSAAPASPMRVQPHRLRQFPGPQPSLRPFRRLSRKSP